MGWLYHDIHLHYWMAWKQATGCFFPLSLADLDSRPSFELELPIFISISQIIPLTSHKLQHKWRKSSSSQLKPAVKTVKHHTFLTYFFPQWSITSIPTIPTIHSPLSSFHLWIRFGLVIGHQDHVLDLPQDLLDALHILQALAPIWSRWRWAPYGFLDGFWEEEDGRGIDIYRFTNANTGLITPPPEGIGGYLLASFLDDPLIISNSEP